MRREGGEFAHFSWTELKHYDSGADYAPLQFDQRARVAVEAVPEGPVDRNIEWVKWDHDWFDRGASDLLGPSPSAEEVMRVARTGGEGGGGLPWLVELARRIGWVSDGVRARF